MPVRPSQTRTLRSKLPVTTREPSAEKAAQLTGDVCPISSCSTGQGHTIPNGQPPAPLFPGSELCALLLMPTVLEPDAFLGDHLTIESDPVNFLWIVPLTRGELDLKLNEGLPALLQRFDEGGLSHVLDEGRASLV